MAMQTRIEISASRSHDQPLERGQPHGGVDAFAAEHCASAAAIAEVGTYKGTFSRWFSQQSSRSLRHESMARAMEAIATDTMLLIKVVWHCVEVSLLRQSLVKSCIENRHLWQPREETLRGPDAQYVGRIV